LKKKLLQLKNTGSRNIPQFTSSAIKPYESKHLFTKYNINTKIKINCYFQPLYNWSTFLELIVAMNCWSRSSQRMDTLPVIQTTV